MIISNILSKEVQEKLNLNLYKKLLIALTEDMKDYMDYHRRKFCEKQKYLWFFNDLN